MPQSSLFGQHDREPYAAGRFYDSDPENLAAELKYLFSLAERSVENTVLAIISPHAGFIYSGEVAANSYSQADPDKKYDNIFIIGSSHTASFEGASIYTAGDYLTPLGSVKVNTSLAKQLIGENRHITFKPDVHSREHIIENQLPYLQYHLNQEFSIVPILIGTDNEKILRALATTLAPYLNEKNLFVISADFSHYPNYDDACKADSTTAQSIASNDIGVFKEALMINRVKEYPNMVTSTCGSTAIKTLLYITESQDRLEYVPLKYMNSGDAPMGDKNRVVGYYAIVLVEKGSGSSLLNLNETDQSELLRVARLTLDEYINKKEIPVLDPDQFSALLRAQAGVFVTLKKDNKLRGCVGVFQPEDPLYRVVQRMTIAAATQDSRFQAVRPEELKMIEIEISVLTPLKKIESIEEIHLGRDGIYLVMGNKTGTLLPQVAWKTGWSLDEFLGHCARDKAGIGWEGWKEAEIFIYQAIAIAESPHPEQ